MRSAPDCIVRCALVATFVACTGDVARTASDATSTADTMDPMQVADPDLMSACDSVEQSLRVAVMQPLARTNGQFTGTARGAKRWGCRLAVSDTLDPELPLKPLETVQQTLLSRAWQVDTDYNADSSDGAMIGMRSGTVLCVLQHFWESPSDDERASHPATRYRYDVVIECFREAPR